jgi:Mg2+ and Co2+ transporter CorA
MNLGAYRLAKQNNLNVESYYALMMDNIDEVTDKRMEALEEIEKDKRGVARSYNKKVKAKSFQVGDLVWKTIYLLDLKVTSSTSGLQVGKVRTRLSRFVLGILTWWKLCKESDFQGLSMGGT